MAIPQIPAYERVVPTGNPVGTEYHFAVILDGVVQTIMGLTGQMAGLIVEVPVFVQVDPQEVQPGMIYDGTSFSIPTQE